MEETRRQEFTQGEEVNVHRGEETRVKNGQKFIEKLPFRFMLYQSLRHNQIWALSIYHIVIQKTNFSFSGKNIFLKDLKPHIYTYTYKHRQRHVQAQAQVSTTHEEQHFFFKFVMLPCIIVLTKIINFTQRFHFLQFWGGVLSFQFLIFLLSLAIMGFKPFIRYTQNMTSTKKAA